ncbi:hypothetical protein BpHYR1_049893 [Brachionus plicatilis]|uniref:Uncharacterized protein n=1 Tax=Brachionus plicatilis TaxID=10195 RepID=A0A3M7QFF2_BRAPC|nr:hypothetical protein BpHYR1_049893 [Brachionus plicatilis]
MTSESKLLEGAVKSFFQHIENAKLSHIELIIKKLAKYRGRLEFNKVLNKVSARGIKIKIEELEFVENTERKGYVSIAAGQGSV